MLPTRRRITRPHAIRNEEAAVLQDTVSFHSPRAARTQRSRKSTRTVGGAGHKAGEFVARVRRADLSSESDADLRARADAIRRSEFTGDEEALVECAALVDETMRRRIGAWRALEHRDGHADIAKYRESPHRLDEPARVIAETMDFVNRESASQYVADIALPARFYHAVSQSSIAEAVKFEPTDEQIAAGRLMLDGMVVEMDAGEGKTISAAFSAAAHALHGRKAHVITANDYLALRDAEMLAPAYEALGLTVSAILSHMGDSERRSAYRSDIMYGALREFGFDYLRDNLRYWPEELVQSGLHAAIVDEADHVLIDEGRTPLIISGKPTHRTRSLFRVKSAVEALIHKQRQIASAIANGSTTNHAENLERFAKLMLADPENEAVIAALASDPRLIARACALVDASSEDGNELADDLFYTTDLRRGFVMLTEKGAQFIERRIGLVFDTSGLHGELSAIEADQTMPLAERRRQMETVHHRLAMQYGLANQVHQMIRAYLLLKRGEDYIVSDGRVVLVDDLTGRRKSDSKYQHGLQTALDAKENVRVEPEPETLAYLTVEGFLRQYDHVSGTTGTAVDAAPQFRRSYGLDVVRLEPSNPSRRVDRPPRMHSTRANKLGAIVNETAYWHSFGRPVLIGARTVDQSDEISALLTTADIPHNRLDAVTNDDEARAVRKAGSFGAVTVATNMAGRGTDIILDGDLDERLIERFARKIKRLHASDGRTVRVDCGRKDVAEDLAAQAANLCIPHRVEDFLLTVVGTTEEISLEFGLGLHVIGTEMNDAARIDMQLRGRSGRQGQHGSSRFALSLEDHPFVTARHRMRLTDAADARTFVERTQAWIEQDRLADRAASGDLERVIELHTLAYYRERRALLDDDTFDETCREIVSNVIHRLISRVIPPSELGNYERRFGDLREIAQLDFCIDIEELRSLGAAALSESMSAMVAKQIRDDASTVDTQQYARLGKTMILQVSDRLWTQHLYLVQEMASNARLSALGHRSAVSDLIFRAERAYRAFWEQVSDEFVRRLATFHPEEREEDESISLVDDLEAILV